MTKESPEPEKRVLARRLAKSARHDRLPKVKTGLRAGNADVDYAETSPHD